MAADCFDVLIYHGPIVQSPISTNPRLNLNPLFWFVYFCSTVCFKTLKNKSSIDPSPMRNNLRTNMFHYIKSSVEKFDLNV